MAQGLLPFKFEQEKKTGGITGLAGLTVYLDLARKAGLRQSIESNVGVRTQGQGWTDSQIVLGLILLNLAGGDCVEDIKVLEAGEGFCEVLKKAELYGLKRGQRRELLRRWRKQRSRSLASASAIFRYLAAFHDPEQEQKRIAGKAFIPAPNESLQGLGKVNKDLVGFASRQEPQETATLDMDATIVETHKADARFCYKGYKSYQPLNTWWAEQEVLLHTEFRDGNVPAGYEQLRVLQESHECLPEDVGQIRMRSDTAGYQHDLMGYCERGASERFGRIEFAISSDVTPEFKKAVAELEEADWQVLYRRVDGKQYKTKTQWAEVCFVPNAIGHSKKGPAYRYIAKREALAEQPALPGLKPQPELPFQTMHMQGKRYKLFGIVTNKDWDGERLITWHHKRCGKSEEAHAVMKHDLAGGRLPSGDFGENAAWWWVMVLAYNLHAILKRHGLGKAWHTKRMKAIRFAIICLPGRVLNRSRGLIVRLAQGHPSYEVLVATRGRIAMMKPLPAG
ncbi:IS1380 family transposase [Thermodesulfobacteriota bacterium]